VKNQYALAIELGEEDAFFLGRGKYFYLNRDRNEHDQTSTGMYILDYSKGLPCQFFLDKFNLDFNNALKRRDITGLEFQKLIGLIFFYFVYRIDEKKFNCDWIFSAETLTLLKEHYYRFSHSDFNMNTINSLLDDLKIKFGWNGWN
jgi:hypothetical protein